MTDAKADDIRQVDRGLDRTGRAARNPAGDHERAVDVLIDCRAPPETDRRARPRRERHARRGAEAPALAVQNDVARRERREPRFLPNAGILSLHADADADPIVDAICDVGIQVVGFYCRIEAVVSARPGILETDGQSEWCVEPNTQPEVGAYLIRRVAVPHQRIVTAVGNTLIEKRRSCERAARQRRLADARKDR